MLDIYKCAVTAPYIHVHVDFIILDVPIFNFREDNK